MPPDHPSPLRLFVAIWLPEEGQKALAQWIEAMDVRGTKPVRKGQFHITLLFLGDVEKEQVSAVSQVLEKAASSVPPFTLEISGTGGFPVPTAARVWFFTLTSPPPEVYRLAHAVREGLAPLGFRDRKAFHPHITFARIRGKPRPVPEHPGGTCRWSVKEIALVQSVLGPEGPRYTLLKRFPLRI